MEVINGISNAVNGVVWGAPMLLALLCAGAYFSVRTGFFQLRHAGHILKRTIFSALRGERSTDGKSISQLQAMTSALAATLGTGNIAGVSTALAAGGAGAVFWMWVSAVFGMMTGFAENVLGLYYRRKSSSGEWRGGAMYYISGGLAEKRFTKPLAKPLAVIFAALCVLSAFGMGNMTQINSAVSAIEQNFGVPALISGIALAVIAALIVLGGIKRIGSVTEKIVPLMSLFYLMGAVWILIANAERIPSMLGFIFRGAFGIDAVSGGVSGYIVKQAVSMGFRRGVFSNEAGLGTSVAAHAAADTAEPCVQGMWSIFEVFFDTIVMCSLTAFILLCSPCNAPTAGEAFCEISTSPRYFRLTEGDGIITSGAPALSTDSPSEIILCRTIYGTEFTLPVSYGETTFSNIMTVTGVQAVSAEGEPLFIDGQGTVPLIDRAVIAEVNGAALAAYAFSQTFGGAAGKLLAIAVLLFAFSTVIGWSYFGSEAAAYVFGDRAVLPFKILYILFVPAGALVSLQAAWGISDSLNGLMAAVNLFAVLCLSGRVLSITRNYCGRVFGGSRLRPLLSADSEIQAIHEQSVECGELS